MRGFFLSCVGVCVVWEVEGYLYYDVLWVVVEFVVEEVYVVVVVGIFFDI